jgi:hypothetical protein
MVGFMLLRLAVASHENKFTEMFTYEVGCKSRVSFFQEYTVVSLKHAVLYTGYIVKAYILSLGSVASKKGVVLTTSRNSG